MFRLRQKEMDLREGNGPPILMADKSGSMPFEAFETMDKVIPSFKATIPGLRVYGFHAGIAEAPYRDIRGTRVYDGILDCYPEDGMTDADWRRVSSTGRRPSGNATYLGACLEAVADLNPRKIVIFCDGGAADKKRALSAADRMLCAIDCYWFHARERDRELEDPRFLEQLARRGRGKFVDLERIGDLDAELRRSLRPYTVHRGWKPSHINIDAEMEPMSKGDFWGEAPRVDVHQPDAQEIYIEHRTDVYHQHVFNHHWLDAKHIEHGGPKPVAIGTRPVEVNIIESAGPQLTIVKQKSMISRALTWLTSESEEAPMEKDCGLLQQAPRMLLPPPSPVIAPPRLQPVLVPQIQTGRKT